MGFRKISDIVAGKFMALLSLSVVVLALALIGGLFWRSELLLDSKPLSELLFGEVWNPSRGLFGFWPFIMGSLWVTGIASVIAVPLSVLTAVYLSEYASSRVRTLTEPVLDLLSGIPSVIFGVWGVLVLVPLIRDAARDFFDVQTSGFTVLTAGVVLSVMIIPLITHVSLTVFRSIPKDYRDATLSVGATRWQMVKYVLLRKSLPGLAAAVVLGVSRAFGETMAVIMVAGTIAKVPASLFDPGYPIPALIANNYGEVMSLPLSESALMFAALILLFTVLAFNAGAQLILLRLNRGGQ